MDNNFKVMDFQNSKSLKLIWELLKQSFHRSSFDHYFPTTSCIIVKNKSSYGSVDATTKAAFGPLQFVEGLPLSHWLIYLWMISNLHDTNLEKRQQISK